MRAEIRNRSIGAYSVINGANGNLASVAGTASGDTVIMAEEFEKPGIASATVQVVAGTPVALTGGDGIVLAAGDNELDLAGPANLIRIQNNTAAVIKVEYDKGASAGSWVIAAGAEYIDTCLIKASVHLFVTGTPTVNGSAANGIIVRARA